jgi:hypothetical protein
MMSCGCSFSSLPLIRIAVKCYLGAPSRCSECEPQLGHMPCRSVPIGPTDRPVTSNTSTATYNTASKIEGTERS